MRNRRQAGSALIVALIMIVFMVAITGVLLVTTRNDMATTSAGDQHTKAGLFALSGVHVALTELNTNKNLENGTGDARVGYAIHGGPNEKVTVRLLDPDTKAEVTFTKPYLDVYFLEATAQAGLSHGKAVAGRSTERKYVAVLKRTVPVPAQADAAVAILGDPSKGEIKIKGKMGGTLVGDGRDQVDPTTGVPGLGIEGAAIDKLKMKFDMSEFVGYDGAGTLQKGPLPINDPTIDYAAINAAAVAMDSYINSLAADPGAKVLTDLPGGKKFAEVAYSFGTGPDSVTVIDTTKKNADWKNVNVTGQGTLIIISDNGHFDMHDSSLTWNGDVFVTSADDKNKDRMKIDHSSEVTINGGLYLLGVGNKSVKLEVHGDNGGNKRNSALTVNGPTLLIADRTDKSKVELKLDAHDSNVTLNGYVGLFGDRLEVKAKQKQDASLVVNGSMVLAVPDADPKTKVKIDISETVDFNFNSKLYQSSIDRFAKFLSKADIPPAYAIASFYEPALR